MKKTISFDLDDTLIDAVEAFVPWSNKKYGTKYKFNEIDDGDVQGSTLKQWIDFFDSVAGMKIKPKKEVKDAINRLSKEYRLIVVSARDPGMHTAAKRWIVKNFPGNFKKILFIKGRNWKKSKADICINEGAIMHFDDNPRHISDCLSKEVNATIVNRPWNLKFKTSAPRINNINYRDIIKIINKLS